MYNFPIGVMLDSFRLPTKEAILKAAEIGANGLQMYSTNGENSPENLTKEKRRELLDTVKSNGMVFSAICGDLGQGFYSVEKNKVNVEKSKRIMELAKDLECDIVTTHIGVIPEDKSIERYSIMHDACKELADFADSMGSHFAVETGPEIAITLKNFLDSLESKGVAVNFDPANFVMVTGDDPVKGVYTLKDYIVHTHAKDGIKLLDRDPEIIYRVLDVERPSDPSFKEVPLGEGSVKFPEYLKALEEVGYRGFLTIEREVGENPAADIVKAAEFLRDLIKKG